MSKESKTKKKIARQMAMQFWAGALVCLTATIVLGLGVFWLCGIVFSLKEHTDNEAEALSNRIDNIVVENTADISDLIKLEKSYQGLSPKQQKQVTEKQYRKLLEAIWLAEQMGERKIGLAVRDKSKNGFDMKFEEQDKARLKAYEGRAAFEGQADVMGDGAKEVFDSLFDGKHDFTVEVEFNPNDGDDFNMIMSKGDNCTALRVSEHSVYFFIKEEQSDWKGARSLLSKEQLSTWLHAAGIYRKGEVSSYLEGSGMTTEKAGVFLPSDFPLGIGYCPESNGKSLASIRKFRIYSLPLNEEELEAGKYGPDSDQVVLWYDFEDFYYEGIDVLVEGIRCYVDSMELKEGEEKKLFVERIPYYASGNILYSSDNPKVAVISSDGVISTVGEGTAVVAASVEGTDYLVKIPIKVENEPGHILLFYEQVRNWILSIGLLVFFCALFAIAMLQRRRLIFYLARLSDEISVIGGERKEGALPELLDDAELAIQRVEENFRKKDDSAREAEQRKNDLVVYLAHDLKTPIASLIGYLTLLRDEKQISADLHRHYVDVALNNSERLDELINELFEIARYNMSQITLNRDAINLTWLMEQLVYEFGPMLAEKGLSCKLEMPRDVMVCCDADKLERVFENLLRNAMNYSYRDTRIQILVTVAEEIRIVFLNYGKRIPKEQLERIFEQFYRLDQARSTSTGGSGLGLAIAKQIVELHGGTIGAECSGDEIRFTVILPRESGCSSNEKGDCL